MLRNVHRKKYYCSLIFNLEIPNSTTNALVYEKEVTPYISETKLTYLRYPSAIYRKLCHFSSDFMSTVTEREESNISF